MRIILIVLMVLAVVIPLGQAAQAMITDAATITVEDVGGIPK